MRGETVTAQESGRVRGEEEEEGAGEGADADDAAAGDAAAPGAAFADARSSSDNRHATRLFLGVIVGAGGE